MSTRNMAEAELFFGSIELPLTRSTPLLESAKSLPIVGNPLPDLNKNQKADPPIGFSHLCSQACCAERLARLTRWRVSIEDNKIWPA